MDPQNERLRIITTTIISMSALSSGTWLLATGVIVPEIVQWLGSIIILSGIGVDVAGLVARLSQIKNGKPKQ